MLIIYNIAIWIYIKSILLVSFFNEKAKKWVEGRQDIFQNLEEQISKDEKKIWIHCASLGEFEQGRPIIEHLKKKFPNYKLILSFFSPSGFEIRKNYPLADVVCYLPVDTKKNAQRFLDIVQPQLAIFVKYEFWYHYLHHLKKRGINTILISAIFRKEQIFFKPYGSFFLRMLNCFSTIYVQNKNSAKLLKAFSIQHVKTVGDTRIDRVLKIANEAKQFSFIENFVKDKSVIIAGSTWSKDEEILIKYINEESSLNRKFIIAPHEIDKNHLEKIKSLIKKPALFYSQLNETSNVEADVLIIDNIGMLSSIYRYGDIAYIGGGFGNGIHNILEPAAFDLPIIFGPKFQKFEEANQLIKKGGAFSITDYATFLEKISYLQNLTLYKNASSITHDYMMQNKGATIQIMEEVARFL